ncbi:MAG: hypothetical protein ABI425_01645 [Patescibacteria group bacterium]
MRKIYSFLLHHEVIILLLAFLILLRIPNLFEPYWYGDEGIYLTVGAAMRQGLHLYAQTLDHKTPLIYYLAMVPSQFWFRMLLMAWMLVTTTFFYLLTKNLKFRKAQQYISTFFFIIFTTLPWLEGNIPNGELFVMGFIMVGAWVFSRTQFFQLNLKEEIVPIKSVISSQQAVAIAISGFFFSLAILTKVPALFDVVPFYMVGYFTLVDHFSIKRSRKVFFSILGLWEMLSISIVTPLVLSLAYYTLRGTLHDYIDIGILYNFRYAGTWALPALPFGLGILLTMKGKLAIVALIVFLLSVLSKKVSSKSQFIISWAIMSLFGALLSSRPYPHYLLQVVPAFALLFGALLQKIKSNTERVLLIIPFVLLILAIVTIQFGFYSTSKYYLNFMRYLTGRIDRQEYNQRFDSLMSDNYQAAATLKMDDQPRIFIWGTNPTLYALSKKIPVGRFITAFHIADFPGAFDETYRDLTQYHPEFIVVMKSETIKFPEFFTYLHLNYLPYKDLDHMTIYKSTDLLEKDVNFFSDNPSSPSAELNATAE